MKTLEFCGHSNDVFMERTSRTEKYPEPNGNAVARIVDSDGAGIVVVGEYGVDCMAAWGITVAPLDDEFGESRMPDWSIELKANPECSYSPLLVVEAPDDAQIHWEV